MQARGKKPRDWGGKTRCKTPVAANRGKKRNSRISVPQIRGRRGEQSALTSYRGGQIIGEVYSWARGKGNITLRENKSGGGFLLIRRGKKKGEKDRPVCGQKKNRNASISHTLRIKKNQTKEKNGGAMRTNAISPINNDTVKEEKKKQTAERRPPTASRPKKREEYAVSHTPERLARSTRKEAGGKGMHAANHQRPYPAARKKKKRHREALSLHRAAEGGKELLG